MDLMDSNKLTYKEYDEQKLLRVDKHSFGHRYNEQEVIKKERFTYKYIILDIFYDCEHSLKYDMLKR